MENNLLLAIFVLLAATVALVPLAKAAGLGTILGYLLAGVLIGPYGLGLISDSETVRHIAEFGVVMMLFLIGLELQPLELWRMRSKIAGLGITQLFGTALVLAVIDYWLGLSWQASLIIAFSLTMSSTAIALNIITQRGIMPTDAGRGSLAILLLQDVAVIPMLAVIPLLAVGSGIPPADGEHATEVIQHGVDWLTALQIVAAFAITIIGGRYLVRPVMRFVAQTGVREAFTALGLALVIGAALLMESIGLSAALGAFLGGVLLADSEYRHELESNLQPFKGLLLGLFFISVGTSITFSVLVAHPTLILGAVLGLVTVKALIIFTLASLFRMHMADRLLTTILLSQAGEFAFVLLQFAGSTGGISALELEILTVIVALSMAVTPLLLFAFDKLVAPRLHSPVLPRPDMEPIEGHKKIIILGYGRFGQIVTRLLRAQGYEMTLIDDDPSQIDLVKRFGVKVFYGDGGRVDILDAAGAAEAELIVIAVAGRERILNIANMIKRNFPKAKIAARAIDRPHAHELMDIGVDVWERETFRSALGLGTQVLTLLGYSPQRATDLGNAFARHDRRVLRESWALRQDQDAYIGYLRQSTELLNEVMIADIRDADDEKASTDDDHPDPEGNFESPPEPAGDGGEQDTKN